jgi:hypothetical protein
MVHEIIEDLRSLETKCKLAARDCSDEELSEHLQELGVILNSMASVLIELHQ